MEDWTNGTPLPQLRFVRPREVVMLASPFPGMDPFLEVNPNWQVFHGWFIRNLAQQCIGPARELGCQVDVERSVYGSDPDEMEIHKQEYIVIREADEWARALAVVELLSFANKRGELRAEVP